MEYVLRLDILFDNWCVLERKVILSVFSCGFTPCFSAVWIILRNNACRSHAWFLPVQWQLRGTCHISVSLKKGGSYFPLHSLNTSSPLPLYPLYPLYWWNCALMRDLSQQLMASTDLFFNTGLLLLCPKQTDNNLSVIVNSAFGACLLESI